MVPVIASLGVMIVLLASRALIETNADLLAVGAVTAPFLYGVVSDTFIGPSNTYRLLALAVAIAGALRALQTEATHADSIAERTIGAPGIVLILLSVYLVTVNVLMAADSSAVQVLGRLVPVLLWISISVVVARGHIRIPDLALIGAVVFGFACVLVAFAPAPWSACSEFKCSGYGQLFHGAFVSENSFARSACLAMILTLALRSRTLVILVWATGFLILIASESRTSQLALVVALAAAFCGQRVLRTRPAALRLASVVVPVTGLITGLALVFSASLGQYSNRGTIWLLGRIAVADHWVLGNGIDNWTEHVLARNYMHSEALLMLYGGGAVAMTLYGIFISAVVRNIPYENLRVGLGLVTLVLVLGLAEVVANPAGFDATAPYVLALLALSGAGRHRIDRVDGHSWDSRSRWVRARV